LNIKKLTMKKSTILKMTAALAIIFLGYANSWGQNTLTVNGQTLSRDGYNAAGVAAPTTEARDSVTTGGVYRYYVAPDASANTSYTAVLTGSLTSNFKWDVNTKAGSADTITSGNGINAIGAFGAFTNYRQVTWAGTGTLNLAVVERSPAGCSGTATTVPISIVAAPTLQYPSAGGIEDSCFTGTEPLNIIPTKKFWVNFTSPISGFDKGIQMHVNITRANGGTPTTIVSNLAVTFTQTSATSGYFTIPTGAANEFDYFDTYTVTLVDVSDRISRKANNTATGLWSAAGTNNTFTYYIYKTPTTGPIYHLPNM
jgi:hypothetical protein